MNREPVISATVIAGILIAVLQVLARFDIIIDDAWVQPTADGLSVLITALAALYARSRVTPVATQPVEEES